MTALVTALALAVCVIGACSLGPQGDQPTPTGPPTAHPTQAATPSPTRELDEFDLQLAALAGDDSPAGSQLDVLWQDVLSAVAIDGQTEYVPPARVVAYTSGDIPTSACADATSNDFWRDNAFYCGADQTILYDEAWLRDFASRMGSYAPSAILAHEWAHHIQNLLGIRGESLQIELQADCMAGLFMANTLPADPDDPSGGFAELDAATLAFFDRGNRAYDASYWFQADEHGSPVQRITAFATGAQSSIALAGQRPPTGRGFAWCYGYRHYVIEDFVELGPFRLLQPPRTEADFEGHTFVLHPEDDLGYETSTVELTWMPGAISLDAVEEMYPGFVQRLPQQYEIARVLPDADGFYIVGDQPASPANADRSGAMGFIVPRQVDGMLVVYSHRSGLLEDSPDGFAHIAESVVGVSQIAYRLCGDFQSGIPGEPDFNPICMPAQ